MFTAPLLTKAKTWEQPTCPSIDEWIKTMWCVFIYIKEHYSAIKENKIMPPAAAWMDLEIIILSKVSQKEERQITSDIIYMYNLN